MRTPEDKETGGKISSRRLFRLALGGGVSLGLTALATNPLLKAVEGLFAPRTIEAADEVPSDFLKFTDSLARSREWKTVNATDSIPPNTEIRGSLPTIVDSINGAEPNYWQASRALYSANTDTIGSLGQRIYLPYGTFYMANQIKFGENLSVLYPMVEMGDINNPADYTTHRLLPIEGLPKGGVTSGTGGVYSLFKLDMDSISVYLGVGIKNSINPSENGLYMIRFDQKGLPATDYWVKISSGMSRRLFISIIKNNETSK